MFLNIFLFVLVNSALLILSNALSKEDIQKYVNKINARTKCGIANGDRTIPWLANIQTANLSDCTGVLLNERYLLSTASCSLQNPNVTSSMVFFKSELSKDELNMLVFYTEKFIIHPDYDSLTRANNVALLRLTQTISPHYYIRPICISPNPDIKNTINYFKTSWRDMLSSYGTTNVDSTWPNMMSNLNNTVFEVSRRKDCKDLVTAATQSLTFSDYDICEGSSSMEEVLFQFDEKSVLPRGTPLVYVKDDVSYLQGVHVELARNFSHFLNIYRNVHTYLKWIAENIEPYPEPCSRWDLIEGECIPLESCHELKNKIRIESPEFEVHRCDPKQKEDYVCCDPTVKPGEIQKEKKSTLVNYEICGELPNASYDYNKEPFPWNAKIYTYSSRNKTENYLCGGIIIRSRYVLTTASCINLVNHRKEEIKVHVGGSNLKQSPNCWKSLDKNWNCSLLQKLTIDTVLSHPLYSNGNSMYDITILYLVEKITFTNYIRPICLPTQDSLKPDDQLFNVLWTKTSGNHITTESKYITNKVCQKTLEKSNVLWKDTQNQMCSSNSGNKNDLQCEDILSAAVFSKSGNKWFLQGNSYESTCKKNLPIRHVRILNFKSWIEALDTTVQCRAHSNLEGECVPLAFCPSLYETVSNPTPLPQSYINNLVCKEEETICCPITSNDDDEYFVTDFQLKPGQKPQIIASLLKINQYCGIQQSDNYFHDNQDIKIDEFPWLAYLKIYDFREDRTVGCGGSLINSKYVITSAKCVNSAANDPYKSVTVRLGEFHIENATDCVYLQRFQTTDCSKSIDYTVEKILVHPSYSKLANDIALVRLHETVIFTDYIRPICLPTTKSLRASSNPRTSFYITGFGVPSLKVEKPIMKKKLYCSLLTHEQCKVQYTVVRAANQINNDHLCTREPDKALEYTCNDDFGDPLMYSYKNQWFLAGVLSYGKQCLSTLPVIHTKLASYTDWIMDNLEPWW